MIEIKITAKDVDELKESLDRLSGVMFKTNNIDSQKSKDIQDTSDTQKSKSDIEKESIQDPLVLKGEIQKLLSKGMDMNMSKVLKDVLHKFGANKFSEVKEQDYFAMKDLLSKVVGADGE